MLDLADDNFDHAGLNFIGGGMIRMGVYPGGGPANIDHRGRCRAHEHGEPVQGLDQELLSPEDDQGDPPMDGPELPDQRWYIDLDPHYTDWYGDPIPRWTYNFGDNSYNAATIFPGAGAALRRRYSRRWDARNHRQPGGLARTASDGQLASAHQGRMPHGDRPLDLGPQQVRTGMDGQNLFAGGEITDTTGDNTTIGGTHPMGAASLRPRTRGSRSICRAQVHSHR